MTGMRLAKTLLASTAAVVFTAGAVAAPTAFAEEHNTGASWLRSLVAEVITQQAVTVAPAAVSAPVAAVRKNNAKPRAEQCKDQTIKVLREAGFTGANLREAYAIAWRESNGQADLGPGHPGYNGEDMGLFQFNRPTFSDQSWWDEDMLLDGAYNAGVAYKLSKGGRSWWLWGLDGQGNTDAEAYQGIWSEDQIYNWITAPFQKYAKQFDKLPEACH